MLKTSLLAAVLAVAAGGVAAAQTPTPEQIVQRHMDAAAKGDVDAIAADYADDAVAITSTAVTTGRPAIRAMFAGMLGNGSGGGGGAFGGMKVEKVWREGDVGLVSWTMGPVKGRDAFVVKNGKIQSQSVFISGGPPPGAAPAVASK